LGKTAKAYKRANGLPASARTRDELDEVKLAAISFAEALSAKVIKRDNARGNAACLKVCQRSGDLVSGVLSQSGLSACA
jgi:hypothetical protein